MPKNNPDAWGVKADGSNLLGRLLMELRDSTTLHYRLPNDALNFITPIKE